MRAGCAVRVYQAIRDVPRAISSETASLQHLVAILISEERKRIVPIEPAGGTVNGEAKVRGRGGWRRLRIADLHGEVLGLLIGRSTGDESCGTKSEAGRQATRSDRPGVRRNASGSSERSAVGNADGARRERGGSDRQ